MPFSSRYTVNAIFIHGQCISLSKKGLFNWRRGASIPLPIACEAIALPSELHPLGLYILKDYKIYLKFHQKTSHKFITKHGRKQASAVYIHNLEPRVGSSISSQSFS
ncbi:hypothetical protein O6H91_07G100700 [Diphasiastrum complanatum]|uniref:Uncharacterized protein n=1 Tax=Diphasiastrum complanatum TaxID=34168 RepID=A0ACC2D8F8_DIPCM|nr:hypothetical protein O6H91_07G100700 [Diphasiastrum complanatum]